MTKLHYAPVFIAVIVFVCLAFCPIASHAESCPWPEEEGYDTIPYTMYEMELYLPPDTAVMVDIIEATGGVIVWRGAYNVGEGNMPTEMIELSASGFNVGLGGDFEISLDPDEPASAGIIFPCDTTCEWAKSTFDVYYLITTTMPYPMDTVRGSAQMELQLGCEAEPGWNPMPGGTFLPPYGFAYEDPRKVPIHNNAGELVGYVRHRHELPRRQVPSLTTWGVIILTMLITASAGYIIFKRRRIVTVE
jgi:hypothetical protein